ncbi:MAG TPA: hypothetical protein VM870_03320 [Pyrinomonadaceae bacterium]|jgi:hypothetical protein|nr:hypothetical protein [Pyrinomonadaceae bacterium]
MKFYLLALSFLCGLSVGVRAQDQKLCKGRPVPTGYRIVGEAVAAECGNVTAWVIRKIGAPAPPVAGVNGSDSELGEGAPDAELRTVRKLHANIKASLNIPLQVNGFIAPSSTYDGPYLNSEPTHSAFTVSDGTGSIYVYALKNEAGALRKKLAERKGKVRGVFTIVMSSEPAFGGEIYADLIGYRLIETPPAEVAAPPRGSTKPGARPRARPHRTAPSSPTLPAPPPAERPVNNGGREFEPPRTLSASRGTNGTAVDAF